ncbi:compound eye opsin BCRH2-like [Oratosquilla oratoria]|uniref:compound eye opsin BCRH2-like n=1 Tax=Oratosquilla oratoria TaxID=337810 RepID=UPI003F759875
MACSKETTKENDIVSLIIPCNFHLLVQSLRKTEQKLRIITTELEKGCILDSCSFDYLSCDVNRRSYGLCIFTFDFVIPLTNIVCSYVFIVKAIFAHEKAMREQAKKMNVSTLRSNADSNAQSAEVRIAKVAMTNVALWIICWTPYAAVVIRGLAFDQSGLTPLVSLLPSLLAKTDSVYNPMIYAINHPKFRLALQKTLPWFCIREPEDKLTDNQSNATKVEAKE